MPSTEIRQTVLIKARHVVVKIGTQLIARSTGTQPGIDTAFVADIARQVAALRQRGIAVTLVSSGAVGAGCAEIGLPKRPTDLAAMQAVAAIGQRRLMTHWHDAFAKHGIGVGQVLLTRTDFDDRTRFLNIRNCVSHLHELGCIAVLNENDTVSVDELSFGDNDMLAALMCNALPADALVLLTVVEGLLDADGAGPVIDRVDDVVERLAAARRAADSGGGAAKRSAWGTGGIRTKLEAARLVTEAGEIAVIASGKEKDVLTRLLSGEKIGTLFVPATRRLDARQRWIGLTARPNGILTIDDGAANALLKRGKSLLATGIAQITGRFDAGDVVMVRDHNGREIARGLINFSGDELRLIQGKRSNEFAKLLGRSAYAEVIHRDNLVLLGSAES